MRLDEEEIIAYLERIPDPRERRGVRYRFSHLLLMAVYAILAGCSEAMGMEYYAELNAGYFRELLGLKTVPSHDTFSRMMQMVDFQELGSNIAEWIRDCFPEICRRVAGYKVLHVDGKATRAAASKSDGGQPVYNMNAMYEGEAISLNLMRVGDKENEISVLPRYLSLFDLRNTVVTIDAIGCNSTVIGTITGKGGRYLVPVKENQPRLLEVIRGHVEELERNGRFGKLPSAERTVKEHGRIETMRMTMVKDTGFIYEELGLASFFGSIARVGVIDKKTVRKENGEEKTSRQRSYVVTNLERVSVENMLAIKLSHWNVEAQHWILDVQLNEDRSTARKGNAAASSAVLRRFCVLLRKYCPDFETKPLNRFLMANMHDIKRIEKLLFINTQK